MTTFTPLKEGGTPSISIHPSRRLNPIDRNIYAGFTEHMGRCIYGGIYDPDNPNKSLITSRDPSIPHSGGFRKDVLSALSTLSIPMIRYPGGNFTATYHWQDGVGPNSSRPHRPDLAWSNIESNQFGTDEFMAWLKTLSPPSGPRVEPYFCFNMGTGTLDEALAWLEYCNGTQDTHYANLRRANGHPEPYNIQYWALGNEIWGPWQVLADTPAAYAEKAFQWAKAIKMSYPSLKLVLCGKEGATSWDYEVLKHCIVPTSATGGLEDPSNPRPPLIDYLSIHLYTCSDKHVENVIAPLTAQRAIEVADALIDLAFVENSLPATQPRPRICFDEWNVWDPVRAIGSAGAEERYTLSDALAVGVWLNVFVRKSREVGIACLAQSVNVIAPLMTTESGIVKQTIWYPLELFCRFMKGEQVAVHLSCGIYDGTVSEGSAWPKRHWLRGVVRHTPWLDVSATVDEEGWVSVAVVNIHEVEDMEVEVEVEAGKGDEGEVKIYTVSGKNVRVTNMDGKAEVTTKESTWDRRKGAYKFPKHSMTMLRWKTNV